MTTSTCTTAILASDFSSSTTDVLRHRWTTGKMRHVIAALDGQPVVITTDKMTGHTQVGVTLLRTYTDAFGPRVTIRTTHSDGTSSVVNHNLDGIGEAIIPMGEATGTRGAKWEALDADRIERGAAIAWAAARHGEIEGRTFGRWTATPLADSVSVRYEPATGNPAYADRAGSRGHWKVPLAELRS